MRRRRPISAGRLCQLGLLVLLCSCSGEEERAAPPGPHPDIVATGILKMSEGCAYTLIDQADTTVILLPPEYEIDETAQQIVDHEGAAHLAGEVFAASGPIIVAGQGNFESGEIDYLRACGWPDRRGVDLRSLTLEADPVDAFREGDVDLVMLRDRLTKFLNENQESREFGWAISLNGDDPQVMLRYWSLSAKGDEEVERLMRDAQDFAATLVEGGDSISAHLVIERSLPITPGARE